jgi:CRP-like cAMP-binding protein
MARRFYSARLTLDSSSEMGVVENRPRSATARAASDVEAEILSATDFFDQIANSPNAARELIRRLSQRLREADDASSSTNDGAAEHVGAGRTSTPKRQC